jgi:competence protein ComEC
MARVQARVATAWPSLVGLRSAAARRPVGDHVRGWVEHEIEQRRLFPWTAVLFGCGILLFFAADEPSLWAPLAGAGLAFAAAVACRARPVGLAVALGLAALFAGFAAGVIRTRTVAAPVLDRIRIVEVSGFVEAVEPRAAGTRLVLRVHEMAGVTPAERPRRIRVTSAAAVKAGDFVALRARLLPLPEPARPGGYDFGRDAYFRGLGAVGSVLGAPAIRPPPHPPDRALALAAAIDRARNAVAQRIATAIGGQAGALAAALVTGKRGLVEEETSAALRGAGIFHIVAISGLHMVLAAGTFFWLVRALLALSPAIALTVPIKKIAAVAAMAGAAAYCVFSGAAVSTERALVMILVMLGAVLFDRPALSMRNLAFAALIVLAREPDALLGPSFQMSYAAVAGLIAAAEWARARPVDPDAGFLPRPVKRALRAGQALAVTTVVASLATAPFAAHHFHTAYPLGLLGNLLALPVVSLAVMPLAVVGALAYPFGLDRPLWWLMGLGLEAVLAVADLVSGLAGATVPVPAFGAAALGLLALALVLTTLLVSPLRWLALVPAALGLWLAATPWRPDLYVDRTGAGAALRGPDGALVVVGRSSTFVIGQWLKADGDARGSDDPTLRAGSRCDALGCVGEVAGRAVAVVSDRRAFAEDCARAAVVVSRLRAPADCAALVFDAAFLAPHGAAALRWSPRGAEIVTSRRPGERPPWRARPRAAPAVAPAPAGRPAAARNDAGEEASPDPAEPVTPE